MLPTAASFTSGLIKDIGAGKNIRESAKKRGKKNLKKMGSRILSGKGIKSKKVRISQKARNGRKNAKIFKKKKRGVGSGLRNKKLSIKSKNKRKPKSKSVKKKYSDIFS